MRNPLFARWARQSVTAVLAAVTLTLLGLAAPRAAHAANAFTLFDDTAYSSATIGHGAITSNLVPNSTCSPLVANGAMPTQAQWQSIVEADDPNPSGILVLDCESLYLNGSASSAQSNYNDLLQLQAWARAVEPNQTIGWYGLLNNTTAANYPYYQNLITADPETAFFPSLYTFSTSEETWDSTLATDVSTASAINANTPIYPYIWPQYHQGSSPSALSLTFIPAAQWSVELATIAEEHLAGVVVWGGSTTSGTCDATCESTAGTQSWLGATQDFLTEVANPQTDLALGTNTSVSSVNVTGRGGPQAVDGDPTTRWGSQYADPQWITVDLGAAYNISGFRLMWETAYGSSYQIQTSDDDATWTTIYSTTTGAGGVEQISGLTGTGRYVRMYGTARGTTYGYSLWDFNVYGTPVV